MNIPSNLKKYSAGGVDVKRDGNVVSFRVPIGDIKAVVNRLYFSDKLRLLTMTAVDERKEGGGFKIVYLFGAPGDGCFVMPYIALGEKEFEFPSVTREIHEASGYERKIWSFFGLVPIDHPHLRPIILHENWPEKMHPLRKDFDGKKRPPEAHGTYDFHIVEGEGIYEIPVGPVHAGIIEPGHFRFSVAGEEIILLEPRLGYKHKGIEKLFETLPIGDKVRLSERVSGDASFTHSLAFCQALESLADVEVPERAKYLRIIYSELERLANHLNDIGFIMNDTGFGFGGANGARLREAVMQWSERLTASRFLRGANAIGGVNKDISADLIEPLAGFFDGLRRDFDEVIGICEDAISVVNRLEGTGKLDRQCAIDHGVVGVPGRALGLDQDARTDHPYAAYDRIRFDHALECDGDVRARFAIRVKEVRSSIEILKQAIGRLPDGEIKERKAPKLRRNAAGVGIAEGWRGAIVYLVMTDAAGEVSRVDVRDPSFLNWAALGYAGPGNIVADFPLINKSFNLSYSGNDL